MWHGWQPTEWHLRFRHGNIKGVVKTNVTSRPVIKCLFRKSYDREAKPYSNKADCSNQSEGALYWNFVYHAISYLNIMIHKPGLQKTWLNLKIRFGSSIRFGPWRDVVVKYMKWLCLHTEAHACNSRHFLPSLINNSREFSSGNHRKILLKWMERRASLLKSWSVPFVVKGSKTARGHGSCVFRRLCVMQSTLALHSALEFCSRSWWGTLMPQEKGQVCWSQICLSNGNLWAKCWFCRSVLVRRLA